MAGRELKICWVGFHEEGIGALAAVLEAGYSVSAVLTLDEDGMAARCAGVDYSSLCDKHGVPLHRIRHINDEDAVAALRAAAPDVTFVIGWSQIVGPEALGAAKIGTVGAHASLLPHNRGSAPINWAIINGEEATGNTLMWLDEGLDSGDIIDQVEFPITPYDTCASLYDKVAESNRYMIIRLLEALAAGEKPGAPQPESDEEPLPRRRPADGLINWTKPAGEVYNFVRALASPYPGAFGMLDGAKWIIWECAALPGGAGGEAGENLGPVCSPRPDACGQAVACGAGAIVILEAENTATGETLRGRALADMNWKGRTWENE